MNEMKHVYILQEKHHSPLATIFSKIIIIIFTLEFAIADSVYYHYNSLNEKRKKKDRLRK